MKSLSFTKLSSGYGEENDTFDYVRVCIKN